MNLQVRRALLAAAGIAVALGGMEGALRIGLGSPPQEEIWDQFNDYYSDIYDRFFRLALDHSWKPVYRVSRERAAVQDFPMTKGKTTFRVFIVGGSVAMRFSDVDASRIRELFARSLPGRTIEVIGCGMGGYDSYRDSLIEREVLRHEPDAIVVLSGNNEYYEPETVNPTLYRLNRELRRFWLFRWPQDRFHRPQPPQRTTLKDRLANLEDNLTSMARAALDKNVPVVFCTLPADIRDVPPLSSAPRWDSPDYGDAWNALDSGDERLASSRFERYVSTHPDDPFGHYWLARLLDRKKLYARAKEHYRRAVDLDDPGDRCSSERNEVIRRVAKENGMITADLEKEFERIADHNIPDANLFADQVHWQREYYPLVSAVILHSIESAVQSGNTLLPPASAWDWRGLDGLGPEMLLPSINRKMRDRFGEEAVYRGMTLAMQEQGTVSESALSFFDREAAHDPGRLDFLAASPENLRPGLEAYPWFGPYKSQLEENWNSILLHIGETYRRRREYAKALAYFARVPELELARRQRAKTLASLGRKQEPE